jgi:hypothetical protein
MRTRSGVVTQLKSEVSLFVLKVLIDLENRAQEGFAVLASEKYATSIGPKYSTAKDKMKRAQ